MEGEELFDDYVVRSAQRKTTRANREVMMERTCVRSATTSEVQAREARRELPPQLRGANGTSAPTWLTWRRRVPAFESSASSPARWARNQFIVCGKGNEESFCTCSHGLAAQCHAPKPSSRFARRPQEGDRRRGGGRTLA